jgi:methyl-accepting chemotaxis protein
MPFPGFQEKGVLKMNSANRRRFLVGLIVDWKFQSRYIFNNILLLLIFAGAITLFIYLGTWNGIVDAFSNASRQNDTVSLSETPGQEAGIGAPLIVKLPFTKDKYQQLNPPQKLLLNEIILRVNSWMWPLVAGLIVYIIMISLIFSHRIAGPVFKMKRSAGLVAKGDLTANFTIRKYDELTTLSNELENAVGVLRGSMADIQKNMNALKKASSEEERKKCLEGIEEVVSRYKTSRE